MPFAILIARARAHAVTGELAIGDAKSIYFLRGAPVDVVSRWPDEITETYMLRAGVVHEDDVGAARAHAVLHGERFGEALLGMGLLRPHELFDHATRSAQERLVACFGLRSGIARFDETFAMGPGRRPIPLDTVQALGQGLERFYDRSRLDRELPVSSSSRVYTVDPTGRPWLAEGLGTIDARLHRLADDRPTLGDVVRNLQRSEEDVRRRLYALYCLGLVGFEVGQPDATVCEDTPPPYGIPDGSRRTRSSWLIDRLRPPTAVPAPPPERVAMSVEHLGPTPDRISTAPRSPSSPPLRSASSAPPAHSRSTPPPGRVATTPQMPRASYPPERRSSPPGRVSTPPQRSALLPKAPDHEVTRLVDEAELARMSGDKMRAIVLLREAQQLHPESALVLGDLAITLFLQDPRRWAREANVLARHARQLDPALPKPYVVLGLLLEQVSEPLRAVQLYRYALGRDPECVEAQECLERLGAVAA